VFDSIKNHVFALVAQHNKPYLFSHLSDISLGLIFKAIKSTQF